jgi:hypothetical protein
MAQENTLAFPQELRDDSKAWPFIRFSCKDVDAKSIFFPIPQGLSFSDSMAYSTIDLGILGDVAAKGMIAAQKAGGTMEAMEAGVKTAGNAMLAKAKSANVAAAASIAARQLLKQEQVANVIDFASKQVIAPNTNATFQNSNIRSFQFNFKLVSRTLKDSNAAREIIRLFQEKMYPIGKDVIMEYPPAWDIKFYNGEGNENKFIPGTDIQVIGMKKFLKLKKSLIINLAPTHYLFIKNKIGNKHKFYDLINN